MDARVISAFTRVFDALLPAHDYAGAEITRVVGGCRGRCVTIRKRLDDAAASRASARLGPGRFTTLAAARCPSKQPLEKSTLTRARVVGKMILRGALLLLIFHFETGANELVDLVASLKVALGELPITLVARLASQMNRVIAMNSSLFLLSLGLLVSRSVKAARRTRASFERSSLYTCDFESAPCLTMMVSPGGRPYSPKPSPWRTAL